MQGNSTTACNLTFESSFERKKSNFCVPNTFKKELNRIHGFRTHFASFERVLFLGEKTWEETWEKNFRNKEKKNRNEREETRNNKTEEKKEKKQGEKERCGKETITEKKGEKNGGKWSIITSVVKRYFFPIKMIDQFFSL